MPRGSLYDLLHGAAGVVVDTAQAVRFALDIARGMAFLHSLERIIPEYHLNSFHVMVSERSNELVHDKQTNKECEPYVISFFRLMKT